VRSTATDVLAVPVSALSTGADGTTRVQVVRAGGAIDLVRVQAGLSAQGLVEVTPLDGALRERDRVIVGQQ
jgi:hypothetical protein